MGRVCVFQVRNGEVAQRNLQNELTQLSRKYDQKSKELEKAQESLSKVQKTLADQQLVISQTRQSQMDSKMSMTNELRLLEKTSDRKSVV